MLVHKVRLIALTILFAGVVAAGAEGINRELDVNSSGHATIIRPAPTPQLIAKPGRKSPGTDPAGTEARPGGSGHDDSNRPRARSGR